MDALNAIFGPLPNQHITWAQEAARTVLIFFYGLALVRLAGRRVFGKWAALDIIVSIVIGSNLSRALTGSAPLWGTLFATALLMVLHWLFAHAAARSRFVAGLVEGGAVPIARDGRLDEDERRKRAVSENDLGEALRQSGVERVDQTRRITLEPSGKLTVLKAG